MAINIKKNVPLAPYTTFKIGGPAKFFVEVENEEQVIEALKYAKENNLNFFILAGGSNILVNDKGFNGLVIKLNNTHFEIEDSKIECGAGANLSRAVVKSVESKLTGIEWAAGIPGTVGGAVRGNSGAFGGEMKDVIKEVSVLEIDGLNIKKFTKEECAFSYRSSIFKEKQNIIILSVVLELEEAIDAEKSRKKIKEIIEKRSSKQPQYPSAGSFFKNPVVKDKEVIKAFEEDTGLIMKDDKIPAGWIIEEAGLNIKEIGGAQISEKHSNFIINTGKATAEDIVILAGIVRQKIRSKFGVQLQEEIQYVGF